MKNLLVFVSVCSLLVCLLVGCRAKTPPTQAAAPAVSKIPDDLAGVWEVTAITTAGNAVPAAKVAGIKLTYTFANGRVTLRREGKVTNVFQIVVDDSATPARLRMEEKSPILAVYDIKNDLLTMCTMVDEKESGYPETLESKASPRTDVLVMRRPMTQEATPSAEK